MPFKFAYICDLLEKLESFETRNTPLLNAEKIRHCNTTTDTWFKQHRRLVDSPETDRVALLSTLFPERRTDRVYYLKEQGLVKIFARCLGLGRDRLRVLEGWTPSSAQDLAYLVSTIQRATDAGVSARLITVEEIDAALATLAARCRFSSPQARAAAEATNIKGLPDSVLRPILTALSSRDLKWFTRLILKRFAPITLDEPFVLRRVHFLLPRVLKFQSSFAAAIRVLDDPLLVKTALETRQELSPGLAEQMKAKHLRPQLGTKVGRPDFVKARSLKHCLKIAGKHRWAIEPKYDGEYCQVHVNLSRGDRCIQIFSKSGKDSTKDREALHAWIKSSLKIGEPECKIQYGCILEGEMVVHSDETNSILEFHKIRKHISRSGTYIGTENDSPPYAHEHLMMVFFDVLLIDNEVVMAQAYEQRRRRLRDLIHYYPGWCQTADWGTLDFGKSSTSRAVRKLERSFAKAIASRCEGLILKPCDRPYFSLHEPADDGKVIKLKKDYIPGLGDTADFAIVGASFNAAEAPAHVKNVRYTSFVIACLLNKDEVCRFQERPAFKVMGILTRPCISVPDMQYISSLGQFCAEAYELATMPTRYDLQRDAGDGTIDVTFKKPFLVDVLGSSFEKPSGKNYYMLRHPRILKLHRDRRFEDVVSFNELQDMAVKARSLPDDMVREEQEWLEKLRKTCRALDDSSHSSVSQTTTESPGSKRSTPCGKAKSGNLVPAIVVDSVKNDCVPCQIQSTDDTEALPGLAMPRHTSVLPTPPTSSVTEPPPPVRQAYTHSTPGKRKRGADTTILTAGAELHKKRAVASGTPARSPDRVGPRHEGRRVFGDVTNSPPKRDMPSGKHDACLPDKDSLVRKTVRFAKSPEKPSKASTSTRLAVSSIIDESSIPQVGVPTFAVLETTIYRSHSALVLPAGPSSLEPQQLSCSSERETLNVTAVPHPFGQHVRISQSAKQIRPPDSRIIQTPIITTNNAITLPNPPSALSAPNTHLTPSTLPNPSTITPTTSPRSPFQNQTFHLSSCISSTPYLTHNLLPALFHIHHPTPPSTPSPLANTSHLTPCLTHWRRALHPNPPPSTNPGIPSTTTSIIQESQSHPTLQKALLVEPRRPTQTAAAIRRVADEIVLADAEVVEIWDWRVVEDVVDILALADSNANANALPVPEDRGAAERGIGAALAAAMARTRREEMGQVLRRGYLGCVRASGVAGAEGGGGAALRGNVWVEASEAQRWEKALEVMRA